MSHTDWTQGSTDQARANKIFEKVDRADDLKPRTRIEEKDDPRPYKPLIFRTPFTKLYHIVSTHTVHFLEKKLHPLQPSIYQFRYFKW